MENPRRGGDRYAMLFLSVHLFGGRRASMYDFHMQNFARVVLPIIKHAGCCRYLCFGKILHKRKLKGEDAK